MNGDVVSAAWLAKTGHPTDGDRLKVANAWHQKAGWVYVAKVGQTGHLLKVGQTGRLNPFERIHELRMDVASTENFELVFAESFADRHAAEAAAHQKLKERGMHRGKEFFDSRVELVRSTISSLKDEETARWSGWDFQAWFARRGTKDNIELADFDWDVWWEQHGGTSQF
jgi:T5orf172 domain